ncbi:MAG: 50S ribosomal protein L32e [Promethearchaeota archaeon]
MTELDRLLKLRAQQKRKCPKFIRQESWRYKRVGKSWRRAKGIDNKVRRKKKGTIASPNIGYKSPKKVRYLHSSGFKETIVHNISELEKINPREYIVKIAHSVGRHKRISLQDKADELNILILNRIRILLPGEELLLEEGRGFEREKETFEELEPTIEEGEEEIPEKIDSLEEEEDLPKD